jgi:hypothetical protein
VTLSKSQIDKLGERLRATEQPTAEDRELLAELLASHAKPFEDARTRVVTNVAGLGYVTGRLKSTPSIIDKLKRSPAMRLSRMQDLAGVRVIVNGGRTIQDQAVYEIRPAFTKSRVTNPGGVAMSRFYVLAYKRSVGQLLEMFESANATEAAGRREDWERKYNTGAESDVEVAMFNAADLDELKRTHSRYFRTLAEMTPTG